MKNKENTKRKLLDAVGDIIRVEGFNGLGVNKVAKSAAVSKILIYRYFGGFNQLVRTYVLEKDFWQSCIAEEAKSAVLNLSIREQVCRLLSEQFTNFYNHCEMEAMLVNEITNHNLMVKNIIKEEISVQGQAYFDVVSTLLLAGTDHLILAEQEKPEEGHSGVASLRQNDLQQSIGQIVKWTLG
jgi:AcrR family transcriptional regulator